LLSLGRKYGFRPDLPIGMEEFLTSLVKSYDERLGPFEIWLQDRIAEAFTSVDARPKWKQHPEWPLHGGRPLEFVGQIDKQFPTNETSFYVFWDRQRGLKRVVVQVLA